MPFCDHHQLLALKKMKTSQKETAISFGHNIMVRRKAASSISSDNDLESKNRIRENVHHRKPE
jgi:hypothetical protein